MMEEKLELVWVQNLRAVLRGEVEFSHQMNSAILRSFNEQYARSATLLSASSTLVEEMKAMGYGETSDRPLPGAWDGFVEALARARG